MLLLLLFLNAKKFTRVTSLDYLNYNLSHGHITKLQSRNKFLSLLRLSPGLEEKQGTFGG